MEKTEMRTVNKLAHWLETGDVIVAPDRSLHTVTEIQHHGLHAVWMTISTDTGLKLQKSLDQAHLDSYDVVVAEQVAA